MSFSTLETIELSITFGGNNILLVINWPSNASITIISFSPLNGILKSSTIFSVQSNWLIIAAVGALINEWPFSATRMPSMKVFITSKLTRSFTIIQSAKSPVFNKPTSIL